MHFITVVAIAVVASWAESSNVVTHNATQDVVNATAAAGAASGSSLTIGGIIATSGASKGATGTTTTDFATANYVSGIDEMVSGIDETVSQYRWVGPYLAVWLIKKWCAMMHMSNSFIILSRSLLVDSSSNTCHLILMITTSTRAYHKSTSRAKKLT